MNVYLSIDRPALDYINSVVPVNKLNILCSFEYRKSMCQFTPQMCRRFMADSGAFTAMNAGKEINLKYVDEYIEWINQFGIDQFIEMDLDEIRGYDYTLELTDYIEKATGKKSIPCWHTERGVQGWLNMCDQYDYIAISLSGSTKTDKWLKRNKYQPLGYFIQQAHKRNTKVHAMGCNNLKLLKKYHFDSADSSTHSQGVRYGRVLYFNGNEVKDANNKRTHRVNYDAVARQGISTMYEVMKYAEARL